MATPYFQPLAQRVAYSVALILVVSGLVHTGIWVVDGGPWEGPLSWRKPILFGFSAGATVFSIGWVASKLPARFGDVWLVSIFAVAMLAEVSLITLQTWRGVPSHFNSSTHIDRMFLGWIEGLIVFATVVICYLTVRCLGSLNAPADMKLAIRGGMLLLVFACVFGMYMVSYGNSRVAVDQAPGIYGQSGVMKFPHGMPIHAIQFLPLLVWLLKIRGTTEVHRVRSVLFAIASTTAFTWFSLLQTLGGRSRFDISNVSGIVLLVSLLLLLPVGFAIAMGQHNLSPRTSRDA